MKLFIVSVILISCLVSIATARHGPSQIQSRAKRVKHLGEWFSKQRNSPVTKSHYKMRSTFGRNTNIAPIGSKMNQDVRLVPLPYKKKSLQPEPRTLQEYLHKRKHDPRPIVKLNRFNSSPIQTVP